MFFYAFAHRRVYHLPFSRTGLFVWTFDNLIIATEKLLRMRDEFLIAFVLNFDRGNNCYHQKTYYLRIVSTILGYVGSQFLHPWIFGNNVSERKLNFLIQRYLETESWNSWIQEPYQLRIHGTLKWFFAPRYNFGPIGRLIWKNCWN